MRLSLCRRQGNTNPLLGTLTDNGGPTDTVALLAGSPAIDAGDAAVCPAPTSVVSHALAPAISGRSNSYPRATSETTAPTLSQYAMEPDLVRSRARQRIEHRPQEAQAQDRQQRQLLAERSRDRAVHGRAQSQGAQEGQEVRVKRKHGKRCTAVKTLTGSFSRSSVAGKNTVKFTGRLNGKRLRPAATT